MNKEIEELANKRALEFIKCVQYSSLKEAIQCLYLQGCKDMAQTLIDEERACGTQRRRSS